MTVKLTACMTVLTCWTTSSPWSPTPASRQLTPSARRSTPATQASADAAIQALTADPTASFEWPTEPEIEIEFKLGVGASYRFAPNWSLGMETLYETEFETEVGQGAKSNTSTRRMTTCT